MSRKYHNVDVNSQVTDDYHIIRKKMTNDKPSKLQKIFDIAP